MDTEKGNLIGISIPRTLYTGNRNLVTYNNEPIDLPDNVWVNPNTGEAIEAGGDYVIEGDKLYERVPKHQAQIDFKLPYDPPIQPSNLEFYLLTGGPTGKLALNGLKTVVSDVANFGWRRFVGLLAGVEAFDQTANGIYQGITGSPNHYMTDAYNTVTNGGFLNPYIDAAGRFMFDFANPTYWSTKPAEFGVKTAMLAFGKQPVVWGNKVITPVRDLNRLYAVFDPKSQFIINGQPYTHLTRPYYYDMPYSDVLNMPKIPEGKVTLNVLGRHYPKVGGNFIVSREKFNRAELNHYLWDMLNKKHEYDLDPSVYPENIYTHTGKNGTFEKPSYTIGPDAQDLIILTKGSSVYDLAYAEGHRMWQALSKELLSKISEIIHNIFKRPPMNTRDAGDTGLAIIKEMLSRINARFLNDNRSPFKDYNEFTEYIDDLPDENIEELITKVHGGHWLLDRVLTIPKKTVSSDGVVDDAEYQKYMDNIRNALKSMKYGGKFK